MSEVSNLSPSSTNRLTTCNKLLWDLFQRVSLVYPAIQVACGFRNEIDQHNAFISIPQRSDKDWPDSKHNHTDEKDNPDSLAVDFYLIVDGKVIWDDINLYIFTAGIIWGIASAMNIPIRWGGNWDGDWRLLEKENWEVDLGHIELNINP